MSQLHTTSHVFAILDHIPMGVFALDVDYNIVFWNRRLEEWTGINRHAILNDAIENHYPHLTEPRYTSRLDGVLAGGPPVIFSSPLHNHIIPALLPDGEKRIQETTVIPVDDGHGGYYAMFTIQDVTDDKRRVREMLRLQKKTEQEASERATAEARLRESDAELRALFAAMNDLILILEEDGTYSQVVDTRGRNMLPPEAKVVGKKIEDIFLPELSQRIRAGLAQALAGRKPVDIEYSMVYKGRTYWHSATLSPMSTRRVVVIVRDITEKKNAQQQETELEIEREKVKLLSDFIHSASHDFRTSLSVLNTGIYLLRRSKTDDQRTERLDRLEQQTKHLKELVNSLFTLSRWDMTGGDLETNRVSVASMLGNLEANFTHRLEQRPEVKLRVLPITIDAPLYADEIEITRAVGQLIDNALNFTEAGEVVVSAEAQGEMLHISVEDTGIGIAEEDHEDIFNLFYKVDKARTRQVGGLGLGLSITRRIVQAHGGYITVESTPDVGSTFTIVIPFNDL